MPPHPARIAGLCAIVAGLGGLALFGFRPARPNAAAHASPPARAAAVAPPNTAPPRDAERSVAAHSPAEPADLITDFARLAANPAAAISRTEDLAAHDPARAREHAYDAIAALHAAGHGAAAAEFAARTPIAPRRDLVIAAYFEWAHRAPDAALTHAFAVTEPSAREFAVQATLSGWAKTDPAGLAQAALRFPVGSDQAAALTKALRYWSIRDPEKAAEWIAANDSTLTAAEIALRED